MSEKRFRMGESDIQGEMTFIDTETNKIYWQEDFDEIVDLVNEQQDTTEKLKKENGRLQENVENLQELVAELGATLLMNGFEIKINDENLSELIDDD